MDSGRWQAKNVTPEDGMVQNIPEGLGWVSIM